MLQRRLSDNIRGVSFCFLLQPLPCSAFETYCNMSQRLHMSSAVGYNTITLRPGSKMCSTSFLQVADESGMTLADLIPVGYKDVTEWATSKNKGFGGYLSVKVLSPGGALEKDTAKKDKCYSFYAPWNKNTQEWGATYWTQNNEGSEEPVEDASAVKFPIGTGLWIEVPSGAYFPDDTGKNKYADDTYKIQHSGAAMLDARQIDLRPGSKGVSITVSSDITLANIHPMGYLDVTEWATSKNKGFGGYLSVKVLSPGGALEKDTAKKDKCYSFYAPWNKNTQEWGATYWTQNNEGSEEPVEDASAVKFPIGTGLWIEVPSGAYFPDDTGKNKYPDNQYKVEFDGIENL